jgi:hypothetical protein
MHLRVSISAQHYIISTENQTYHHLISLNAHHLLDEMRSSSEAALSAARRGRPRAATG